MQITLGQRSCVGMINVQNNQGMTPLWLGAIAGHLNVVALLCEEGADLHLLTKGGCTPLYSACFHGHLGVVKYLLKHGAEVDLHTTNNRGATPLFSACAGGQIEVVKYLLEQRAEVDAHIKDIKGATPLFIACYHGHLEVVKYLINHVIEVGIQTTENDGWTPLHAACLNGHLEVVKYLSKCVKEVGINTKNNKGATPFFIACCFDHLDAVKHLLEHEVVVDIHKTNNKGWTPLYAASFNGHSQTVERLLKSGADIDINIRSNAGGTPFSAACFKGHLGVAEHLLKYGIGDRSLFARALSAASYSGHTEMVKMLLDNGADIDVRNIDGQTPLICTIIRSHTPTYRLLVKSNADTKIVDDYGRTAIDWLKIRKIDCELLRRICDTPGSPAAGDSERLRSTVVSEIASILDEGKKSAPIPFNKLGHCLLMFDDRRNASVAFQQMVKSPHEAGFAQPRIRCNKCKAFPISGSCFVCTTCPDTDLCIECVNLHRQDHGQGLSTCRDHDFVESSPSGTVAMDKGNRNIWLQAVLDEYRDCGFSASP